MIRFDRHPFHRLRHDHRRVAAQQLYQHAVMRRIEMLNKNEGHPGLGGQRGEELLAGIKATRGRTDRDDGKISRMFGGAVRRNLVSRVPKWRCWLDPKVLLP